MLREVTKMPVNPQKQGKIRFAFLQISAYNSVCEKMGAYEYDKRKGYRLDGNRNTTVYYIFT